MKVEGTRSFGAPRETVWEVLNDPARMAETMPGVESFDVLDERHWRANVKIPLGLGGLRMTIDFDRVEQREPEFSRLQAKGRGVGALMSMETQFHLNEESGGTAMRWEADVNIAGPVGGMGQRVLQPIVNQQVISVLNALDRQVMAAAGEQPGPPPEPAPAAPATAAGDVAAGAAGAAGAATEGVGETVRAAGEATGETVGAAGDAAREATGAAGDAAERAAETAREAAWGTTEAAGDAAGQAEAAGDVSETATRAAGDAAGTAMAAAGETVEATPSSDFYPGATPSATADELIAENHDTGIGDTGDTVAPTEGTAGTPPPSTEAPAHTDPEFYVGAEPSVHPPEPAPAEPETRAGAGEDEAASPPSRPEPEAAGPPAEASPGADPAEQEGSSGADEGVNPWSPEGYEADPEGPTTSTEDKS